MESSYCLLEIREIKKKDKDHNIRTHVRTLCGFVLKWQHWEKSFQKFERVSDAINADVIRSKF